MIHHFDALFEEFKEKYINDESQYRWEECGPEN
jgi:hypothetical protein